MVYTSISKPLNKRQAQYFSDLISNRYRNFVIVHSTGDTWTTKTIKTNIRKPSHLSGKPFQILTFYVYTVAVVVMVVI